MAQHDYINKKPANRNNKKQAPAKKPFPIILVLIALILVGGFGYGLWYIKHNADPELVEQQANPTKKEEVVIPKISQTEAILKVIKYDTRKCLNHLIYQ